MESDKKFNRFSSPNYIDFDRNLFLNGGGNCFSPDIYFFLQKKNFEIIQLRGERAKDMPQPNFLFQDDFNMSSKVELLENQKAVFSEVAVLPILGLNFLEEKDMESQLFKIAEFEKILNIPQTRLVIGRYVDYLTINRWYLEKRKRSIFGDGIYTRTTTMMGRGNIIYGNGGLDLMDIEIGKTEMSGVTIIPLVVPHKGR